MFVGRLELTDYGRKKPVSARTQLGLQFVVCRCSCMARLANLLTTHVVCNKVSSSLLRERSVAAAVEDCQGPCHTARHCRL